jgi:hypothetical protein
MIDLLIFEENGLMLLKKEYCHSCESDLEEVEDLVSGFFSAVFSFFKSKFGDVKCIKTEKKLFLITKVQGVYISLLVSMFDIDKLVENFEDESTWIMNKRLEEAAYQLLNEIERKIGTHLFKLKMKNNGNPIQPHSHIFMEIDDTLDKIVEEAMYKISIIRRLISRSNETKKEIIPQEIMN